MTETTRKSIVAVIRRMTAVLLFLILSAAAVLAGEGTAPQVKGLDDQVQEIKSEVLAIATELDQLEERLLYPSHTQFAIFVSLQKEETFRLDSVDIDIDGEEMAHHLYTFKELEALRMGGVQRIYTGNVALGAHQLRVTMRGKGTGGGDILVEESFPVEKRVAPGVVELTLAKGSITLNNR